MKKLVKFMLESNVISAGIKTNNNFLKTEDVINGSVVRAAFANDILLDCEYAEEEIGGKKFWVCEREPSEHQSCKKCSQRDICRKFSDMSFSFLIPENSIPAPFTSKVCKSCGTAHPVMDTIIENGALKCSVCGGRMENLKGIINKDTYKNIKVRHSISTHTSINSNSRIAADGKLFSIEAIRKGEIYQCEIDDCDTGMIYEGKTVYIGKYSSSGFGKLRIISIEDISQRNISEAVRKFNDKIRDNKKKYASILFLSGAKLDVESCGSIPLTTEQYKKIWQNRLFGENAPVMVEQVFAQNVPYHGFNTSEFYKNKSCSRTDDIITEAGSSIKVSFENGNNEAVHFLEELEKSGIGRDTNVGYGKIMVCADIHLVGIGG
mgnify:FL=1